MGNILIFGHRNPDTDSVCSTIALAHLKAELGFKVTPKILSDINRETEYALKYFNVEKPKYLNDVKIRIKDIKYEKKMFINENASIFEGYNLMNSKSTTAIPLVNDNNILTGYVTLKEIARFLISDYKQNIDASLTNVINTLSAKALTRFEENINGHIKVVALEEKTFNDQIKLSKNDILIVANKPKIINYAINAGVKLIILTLNSNIDKKFIKKAKEKEVTILKTSLDTFNIANKISLTTSLSKINVNPTPIVVHDEDYYVDFKEKIHKINHTNYPVINKKGECLGLMRLTGPNSFSKKEVILVDHNSFAQSVVGIEEAAILEIIDHHNLGAIGTNLPINFRSMPVGCTATIIYQMFLESNIVIPKNIAGLMLSAIISDTLLFTSPITTQKDKIAAEKLAKIAKVEVEKYGKELLKAASSLEGMSAKEIVYNDFKSYNLGDKKLGISVVTTMDYDNIDEKIPEIVDYLNEKTETGFYISIMFVTDVIKNGSYIIYNEKSKDIIMDSFGLTNLHQGIFVKGLVSRKKQMLPNILESLGEN